MDVAALAAFAGSTAATSALGGLATRRGMDRWYRRLRKPSWQPPPEVFPVVWTALYTLIAISGYRVYRGRRGRHRQRALALWGAQLVLNGIWSPLFFRQRRLRAALADAGLLSSSVAAYIAESRKVDRPAAAMLVPYLAWTLLATALNAEIVRRN